eukprot:6188517-Pleurochrysis_carterae.AAC.2
MQSRCSGRRKPAELLCLVIPACFLAFLETSSNSRVAQARGGGGRDERGARGGGDGAGQAHRAAHGRAGAARRLTRGRRREGWRAACVREVARLRTGSHAHACTLARSRSNSLAL